MTTDATLRRSLSSDGHTVTLDPGFQGLPDTAHGGTVLALFDVVACVTGPRVVSGVYRRRVPLATPLAFSRDPTGFVLGDGLVEGSVRAADAQPIARVDMPRDRDGGVPLPISKTCFACGTANPLGLCVQLSLHDTHVAGTWTAPERLRAGDHIATVAITTLVDEAAFWLGAAASGEAGMTTELSVHLARPVPFGTPLTIVGSRAVVRAHADDARYWDTEIAATLDDGTCVASASITFVAVRGSARKLVAGLLAVNPPDVLRAVFPKYVS